MGTEFLDKTGLTHLWEQITGKMSNYIPTSQKNAASGVAGLDSSGKIASSLLSTIPINKGGTGATSASAALTNLGAAAVSHKHAASDITSGTLAVARGGTGASDAATARTNLGITPANIGAEAAFDVLPLTKGGLGTTSRTTARENLQVLTYKGYDNGYFETGAGNTSAWLQYQVSGETKCQMDLFSDGKVGIGGKTVLVAGDVIGYTKYNTNKLAMDSWLDNNAYTLALRDDGTDKCVLAMWNGGALSVNGSIVWHRGNLDVQKGTATVGTSGTTITFPRAFAGVPCVCANGSKQTSVRVENITATGCTLVSGESNNAVNWIAVY